MSADDDELKFSEIRLPAAGDRVFGHDGSFSETACIVSGSWWGHAMSYKEAADILVRHALQDTSTLDFVVLPVCFLYRHYVELALKALSWDVARIRNETPPKLSHDLMSQWEFLRQFFSWNTEEILAVDVLLKEWMGYDPDSFSFRYHMDKKGRPSLPADLTHLNIRRIAEVVDKIDALFSGMAGYLDSLGE